ncbi:MAG: A/G-specific adenine glycosylase, partial [bacterium]
LMKLWQGLGYYSRARNLKRAAEKLMAEYGGLLPASAKELKKLPGIGDYTAGAIASLAFGLPEPAVDGNVLRVLSRLLASEEDVMLPATREKMTALLRENYPAGREAGLLTEGLMELGEVVCLPNGQPKCDLCPVHALCLAHRAGRETALPVRAQPKPRRREERTILLLRAGEKYALSRRPKPGLLAGLWEFPGLEGFWDEAALRERFPAAVGITPLGRAKHIFTHIEWHMRGFLLLLPEEIPGYTWATPAEIRQSYAIPTAFKAWVGKLQDETNRGLTGE